jgi:hypothetical protein
MRKTSAMAYAYLTFAAVALAGCAVGFNKNGFYCTEGPTENAPNCFNPKRETATDPTKAATPPQSGASGEARARN